jgi:hypothetical protein
MTRSPFGGARRETGRRSPARCLTALAVAASLALLAPAASAQDDDDTPRLSFGAFGTLGLVYSSEGDADFIVNFLRPTGPGRSETVSLDPDSVLAGQVTFRATPKLTAVVQVVAEQTADDDYDPALEWANLRYDVTPDLSVRVGRFALPAFMVSEHRKVSYATPWVRPPIELYNLAPVTTVDGVDVTLRRHAGQWNSTFDAHFGHAEADFPRGFGKIDARGAWNVNALFQRGDFSGRVAVAGADLDMDSLDPLFDAFRLFGPEGVAIAERFELDHKPYQFAALGAEYDPGRWFGMAEVARVDTDAVFGELLAGYVTVGWRRGSITPYATYSRVELLSASSTRGLTLSGLPPELAPVAAGLNATLNGLLRNATQQQNLAIGGRWDFTAGMALKLQVDFIDVLGDSAGSFSNQPPGAEPVDGAQVVSLATVFVF